MVQMRLFFFIQSSINTTVEFRRYNRRLHARGTTYVRSARVSERTCNVCRHVQFHPDKTFPQRAGARGVVGTVSLDIKHNVRIFMGRVDVAKQLGDFFVMNRRFFSTDFPPIFPSLPCLRRSCNGVLCFEKEVRNLTIRYLEIFRKSLKVKKLTYFQIFIGKWIS